MPALISFTKVRLENLPVPAVGPGTGTPGVFRVKFRAGTAAAETLPRQGNPDGSVEWSEPLEMIVHDTSFRLVAVVSQENSSGGWSLVPGGRFEGALVPELPEDWRGAPKAPTDPAFYARLSVEMEHGTQRDTRLPPYAVGKSGGGYLVPPPAAAGGGAGRFYGGGQFAPERGRGGGRGGWEMDRYVSDASGLPFGGAYGLGSSSGSFGYVDARGSPEVYVDARSGSGAADGAGGGGGVGGGSIDLSSSSGGSSMAGGLVTAVAVPVEGDADAIFPSGAPAMRRASTSSSGSRAARRPSMRRRYPGGWVASDSQEESFRSSVNTSGIGSFSEGSVAMGGAEAEGSGSAPSAAAEGPLPSPVGTGSTQSRLLDPRYQLQEDREEGKTVYPPQAEQEFRPALKRPSISHTRSGFWGASPASLTHERRDTEERVEEVKTERHSRDEYVTGGVLPQEAEKKSWFHLRRKASKSSSKGSSGAAASGAAAPSSAAGSETRADPGHGRSMSMSVLSTASPGEGEDEEEPRGAPPAPRQASANLKKAGRRAPSAFRRMLSRSKQSYGAEGAGARHRPSAPPPGALPTKMEEASEVSIMRASSSASRPPPTAPPPYQEAPPSYQEFLGQTALAQRPSRRSGASAGEGAPALCPELAVSRSRSSSLEPAAFATAAVESPIDATGLLPPPPPYRSVASLMSRSFSPSGSAAPGPRGPGWSESEAQSAQPPLQPSSTDDEAVPAAEMEAKEEELQRDLLLLEPNRNWERQVYTFPAAGGGAVAAGVASAAASLFPRRRLSAAPSETAELPVSERPPSPRVLAWSEAEDAEVRFGGLAREEGVDSADNVYDVAVALGGRSLPPGFPDGFEEPVYSAMPVDSLDGMPADSLDGGIDEESAEGGSPVYSAMPADSLDGSERVDAGDARAKSPPLSLYPAVRPRPRPRQQQQQLEPAESRTTTASEEAANIDAAGFSGSRELPRQLLPRQSTSASSQHTSISGSSSMPPPRNPERAVPRAASNGGGGSRDPVIFSCFAPPAVQPGATFDLQVAAYLRRARDAVLREALSEGAAEAGRPEGMSIAKGRRVTVQLLLPEDKFQVLSPERTASRPSVRDFVWTGEANSAKFMVWCVPGTVPGRVKCEALVIEGSRVKRLSFVIEVAEPGFVGRALSSGPNGEVELDTVMEEIAGNMAEVPFEELEFRGQLGQGVQGVTNHYRWHDKDVAVKTLKSFPDFCHSEGPTRTGLKHEATILSLLGWHPNVVEFHGLSRQGGSSGDEGVLVVTKLEEGGSIEDALGLSRKGGGISGGGGGRYAPMNGGSNGNGRGRGCGSEFDGHVRMAWAKDIACGLAFSHDKGVLHNDVASRNALLSTKNPGGHGLLCDFGLSRFLRAGVERAYCIDVDTDPEKWPILRMPCESLRPPHALTTESDSWMYGMFLYELFAGEQPWAGLDKGQAKRLVMEGKRPPKIPEMLKDCGTRLVKLYEGCLSADSDKRPTLEHVVEDLSANLAPMSLSWGNGSSPSFSF